VKKTRSSSRHYTALGTGWVVRACSWIFSFLLDDGQGAFLHSGLQSRLDDGGRGWSPQCRFLLLSVCSSADISPEQLAIQYINPTMQFLLGVVLYKGTLHSIRSFDRFLAWFGLDLSYSGLKGCFPNGSSTGNQVPELGKVEPTSAVMTRARLAPVNTAC